MEHNTNIPHSIKVIDINVISNINTNVLFLFIDLPFELLNKLHMLLIK